MFSNRYYLLPFNKMNFLSYCNWFFQLAMISNTSRCRTRFLFLTLVSIFFPYSVARSLFSFFKLCVPLHASLFGWQKRIMKSKHLTDLVWILCICLDYELEEWWGRDEKQSLLHIKHTLIPLLSHTLSEVNQPIIAGLTNFLWLKGESWADCIRLKAIQ